MILKPIPQPLLTDLKAKRGVLSLHMQISKCRKPQPYAEL